ncbi:MAG: radical SAM protein [Candidatus Hodarchaeota archaeon]
MSDPIEFSKEIEKLIGRNNSRKYYRFRETRFYGGCATADCVGCNLRCVYCWAQKQVWNTTGNYKMYTPKQVSERLISMNQSLVRISGGEPTLCKAHLIEIIRKIPKNKLFILETNGILLNDVYLEDLSVFENLYIRISLKGVDSKSFERITGAAGIFFENQLKALKLLKKYGIKHRAAIIPDLFKKEQIIGLGIPNLEFESLIIYPFVKKNLAERGFKFFKKQYKV